MAHEITEEIGAEAPALRARSGPPLTAHKPAPQGQNEKPLALSPSFVFELANEIQRQIFEHAARLDGRCAFNLTQVARYVHLWVQPILYERVVIRSPEAAKSFFRTLRSKPRGYIENIVKSLAFDDSVPLALARPILAECSRRVILFSIFRRSDSPGSFLPYIKSPFLRRLTLVFKQAHTSPHMNRLAPYSIPLDVLSSLTHLTIVIEYDHGLWSNLFSATHVYPSYGGEVEDHLSARASFQNLTHFAITSSSFSYTLPILQVAVNLQYFAVLEPRKFGSATHEQLVLFVRSLGDHRLVVLKDFGSPETWDVNDNFRPSGFWRRVESLVGDGFMSDQGDVWLPKDYNDWTLSSTGELL